MMLLTPRLLNILLRALSMVGRFVLILIVAKLLPSSELGIFGLLVASIGFSILFVGFDYYTYSNRELLSSDKSEWARIITNQIYAYLPLYLLFMPISYLLYQYHVLPKGYFFWFYLLMFLEHISIEINRLLNTIQEQLSATIVLFFRTGLWSLLVIPVMVYGEEFRNLQTILYAWTSGAIISIFYGVIILKNRINNWKVEPPVFSWIMRGYKVGFLYILGTISFQAINTGDKFILEQLSDVGTVGIYVFYTSLTVGASAFIHAGVIVFSTPNIITSYQADDLAKFNYLLGKFFRELLFSIFVMVLALYLFMPLVIDWVDKSAYLEYYGVFYIALATIAVVTLSSHPGTYLYASRRDRYILAGNISAFCVFLLINTACYYFCVGFDALYKIAFSVFVTFAWLLLLKYAGYYYYVKQENKDE